MTKRQLMALISKAQPKSDEAIIVTQIDEFLKGASVDDNEELDGLTCVSDFVQNGGYNRGVLSSAPTAKADLEKILAQLHTWHANRKNKDNCPATFENGKRHRKKRKLSRHPFLYWVGVAVGILAALSYAVSGIPDLPLPTSVRVFIKIFCPSGLVSTVLFAIILPLREWRSDIKHQSQVNVDKDSEEVEIDGKNIAAVPDKKLSSAVRKHQNKLKNRQKHRKSKHGVAVLQQASLNLILFIVSILLSISVLILSFCLSEKSFSDYSGWLFTVLYALDCLSILLLLLLDSFICLEIERVGMRYTLLTLFASNCLGLFTLIMYTAGAERWLVIIIGIISVFMLGTVILGLVKHKKRFRLRFLQSCLSFILFSLAAYFGGCAFSTFILKTDCYIANHEGAYTYVINDLSITNLEIPSEYNGKPVTNIIKAERLKNQSLSSLKSVIIPDSVTSIGDDVFSGCTSLESITMPFIGNGSYITHFGYIFGASEYQKNRTCVPVSLKTVVITGGTSIDSNAFNGCKNIENITIPNSVTSIGYGAFSGCTNIKTATIPTIAIRYIPKDNLQTVILTSGDSIGDSAFSGCKSLTSITIPDSVTSIGKDAFYNCGAVKKIKGVSYVDAWTVDCDSTVTSIELLSDTVGIADYAFADCKSINSVTLNARLKYIGSYSFKAVNIKSIIIPQSVKSIGLNAFKDCQISTAIFNITDEWYVDGVYLPSSELSNTVTAATYLKSDYSYFYWERN